MVAIKAVKNAAAANQAEKPKKKTSDVGFPYYDLADAISVAAKMHSQAGGSCYRAQLAALLGHKSTNSGSFLTRVAAAKMFGLIEQTGETLRVSARGRAIVAPVNDAKAGAAKAEAFLAVPLFKKVFDEYNGQSLPAEVGLRNLFEQLGVVPARIVPTVRVMLGSAETAGFFRAAGKDRLVMPLGAGHGSHTPPAAKPEESKPEDERRGGDGGNGGHGSGGDGGEGIHPALAGLLRALPAPGTPMSESRRTALVEWFKNTVAFLYPTESATS